MKKISFHLFIFCLTCCYNTQAQWQTITVPVSGQDIFGISFLNDTTAYVSADHDLVYTQNNFSTFSGTPWNVYLLGTPVTFIREDLREIRFKSPTEGLLTGGFNTFNDYAILQTDNAAVSWDIIFINNSGPIFRYISAMDFNNGNGLACGAHGHIARSTNDGDTWNYVTSSTSENLLEVQFITATSAIAIGENSLLRSSNVGVNWTPDTAFDNKFLYGLAVANGGTNVYTSSLNEFFYSLNGGATFTTVQLPFNDVNCLAAQGPDTVFAGTAAGIYFSADHGMHWQEFQSTQTYAVNRMVIQGGQVYALCNDGYILRTGMNNLSPEPIATFTTQQSESCAQTDVTVTSTSDPGYTYTWYLNGIFQSTNNTGFTYNRSNTTTDTVSVVVNNGISTDTATVTINVHVREYAILSPIADQSGCYDQTFIVSHSSTPGHTYRSSLNNSPFSSFDPYLDNITAYSMLVVEANTTDNCPVYDTSYYTVSSQITEIFLPCIPAVMLGNWRLASADAVSDSTIFTMAETDDFFRSTDCGSTWTQLTMPNSATRFDVIDFVNDTVGYIPHVDFKTVNGGNSFTHMNAFNSYQSSEGIANFLNADTGIVAQQRSNFNYWDWELFITFNGGTTITQLHYFDSLIFNVYDIVMLDVNTIIACGSKGSLTSDPVLMKTTDGGMTWNYLPVPGSNGISAMSILSEDTIFALEGNEYVHRSYDGGQTWDSFYMKWNGCGCEGRIKMINAQVGYLTRGLGEVYKTENGGDCWTQVYMLNDNNISRITVTPSGSDVFISGHNLYHYHIGKNLIVSIDSGHCANSPIYTHNASSGYTSYSWYLDGQLYSSNRDTLFQFASAGNHMITLYADSSGTGVDSIQFPVSIQPSIGSVGSITGPLSACSSTGGFVTYNFTVGTNSQVSTFQWWTDYPSTMTTDLSQKIDSSVDIHLVNNAVSSWYIHLYAVGISTTGCFTSDTAEFLLHLVHTEPSTPTVYATTSDCYFIPEDSMASPFPFDTVLCSVNKDPLADYYTFELEQTTDTFSYMGIYPDSPGQVYLYARAENSCGTSSSGQLPVNVTYVPNQVSHTPDTNVVYGSDVQFYFHPYTNADLLACGPRQIWWTLPNGTSQQTNWEYLNVWNFFVFDTGYYTAYCVMGCDTVFATFHVGEDNGSGVHTVSSDGFYFSVRQHDGILRSDYSMLTANAEIILTDVTGRTLKKLRLVAGTSFAEMDVADLSPGIYQLQFNSTDGRKTKKIFIE